MNIDVPSIGLFINENVTRAEKSHQLGPFRALPQKSQGGRESVRPERSRRMSSNGWGGVRTPLVPTFLGQSPHFAMMNTFCLLRVGVAYSIRIADQFQANGFPKHR